MIFFCGTSLLQIDLLILNWILTEQVLFPFHGDCMETSPLIQPCVSAPANFTL